MENVRTRLGVRSVSWKGEKRVLERIWHVFMMRNERLTKAIVLGWCEELKKWEKGSEKKRKMILHWKRILRRGMSVGHTSKLVQEEAHGRPSPSATKYPTGHRKRAERGRKKFIPFPPFCQRSGVEIAVPHMSLNKLEAGALYCPKTTM